MPSYLLSLIHFSWNIANFVSENTDRLFRYFNNTQSLICTNTEDLDICAISYIYVSTPCHNEIVKAKR
jgi:hypothetical protein